MKFTSALVTAASGSVGGLTASRNRGGMYFRARAIPVNPSSTQQQAVRTNLSSLAAGWTDDLDDAQRAAWNTFGVNTVVVDSLGAERQISGFNHWVRANALRLQAGLSVVLNAPTNFTGVSFGEPEIADWDLANQQVDVSYSNTAWRTEVGGALLVYLSRPQGAGISYFRGPYRLAGVVLGASGTPPTSPATIDLPFPVVAGQQVFGYARAVRADGRIGNPAYFSGLATA